MGPVHIVGMAAPGDSLLTYSPWIAAWSLSYNSSRLKSDKCCPTASSTAADYVLWRANQGTTHALPNDSIGGTIAVAQYNQWRSHFGQSGGSGSEVSANLAVPEPATVLMLTVATAGWCLRQRRNV
jgi:hypothetical protein